MKRLGDRTRHIRIWTARDERCAQRRGGYNHGLGKVIDDDEETCGWARFVDELFPSDQADELLSEDEAQEVRA